MPVTLPLAPLQEVLPKRAMILMGTDPRSSFLQTRPSHRSYTTEIKLASLLSRDHDSRQGTAALETVAGGHEADDHGNDTNSGNHLSC